MTDPAGLRAALARGPLLLDAAMGTRLVALGLDLTQDDPCLWTLDRPEAVLEIHRRDLDAGSDAVLTNTFGANRLTLDRLGRADEVVAINRRAVALAREAAGADRFVLGSIGPQAAADTEATREQVDALVEAGADALFLETHELPGARARLSRLRDAVDLPILVSIFARWAVARKPSPSEKHSGYARVLGPRDGVAAYGCNCHDLGQTLLLTRRFHRDRADVPLIAKPSAGLPGGPRASPEAFAEAVPRLLGLGVRIFGGCCGTTEAHVAALHAALRS